MLTDIAYWYKINNEVGSDWENKFRALCVLVATVQKAQAEGPTLTKDNLKKDLPPYPHPKSIH